MSAVTIIQMTNRVSELLEQKLQLRGQTLSQKVRKAGRRLPRKVLQAARFLGEASEMAKNPKLLVRIDEGEVAQAYDICVRHLGAINRAESRRMAVLGATARVAFAVGAASALAAGVLYWRGLI
ncbi:hypothetical protein Q9295_00185 [Xinfangfangia sp. CPCC 101601]|uniref:Uncharacterized protein n=1 Tax=Pseudogemmobacter lacusdianii TaxID=3069608 RepID=A0ABU0VSS8_9RHOB|nr:hypothetical protein [Xinfangfangia sp. CPCC 101601]MDQ2064777.1 hypothetical protein [Xinfangfangia sp. CPCC 101601]